MEEILVPRLQAGKIKTRIQYSGGGLLGAVIWIIIYELGYLAGAAGAAIIAFSIEWVQTIKEPWNMTTDFKSAFIHVEKNLKYIDELAKITGYKGGSFTTQYYADLFAGYVVSIVVGVLMTPRMLTHS